MRARGDSIPLTRTPFKSSPTVSRYGSKLAVTVAVCAGFEIRPLDASQAFLQSDNSGESDRCVVIPPP